MAGEMRERAAKALHDVATRVAGDRDVPIQSWDSTDEFTRDFRLRSADAVLAVVADVEGIAGVLFAHQNVPLYIELEPWRNRCGGCGVEINGGPNSPDHVRHQAEAVAAHLRGAS